MERNRPRLYLAPADFRDYMAASLAVAIASFAIPLLWLKLANSFGGVLFVGWPLSAFWAIQLRWAVNRYGKRRLWALLGIPFVFWWLFIVISIYAACALGQGCL